MRYALMVSFVVAYMVWQRVLTDELRFSIENLIKLEEHADRIETIQGASQTKRTK